MRHTAVAAWLHAGASLYEASRWAGHASSATTEQIYGHLLASDGPDLNTPSGGSPSTTKWLPVVQSQAFVSTMPRRYQVGTVNYFVFASKYGRYAYGSPCPVQPTETETELPRDAEFTLSLGLTPPSQNSCTGGGPPPSSTTIPPQAGKQIPIPPPHATTV
jgi:hypothetical protein